MGFRHFGRPKRTTNRNSGSHEVIAPFELKPRMPSAEPTESRLSRIDLIGITIERKVISKSRNASPRTKANTYGIRDFIWSLKSFVPAVSPVTATWTSGSVFATGGITSWRGGFRAAIERLSPPEPAIEKSTRATVLSGLTATWKGG